MSGASDCLPGNTSSCSTIEAFGATAAIKQTSCNAYTANSKKCGYASTSSASGCSDAACTDVDTATASSTFCSAYLSTCLYDGQNCIAPDVCTNYNAQTTGSGALINCSNLIDSISGQYCTYVGGTKCAARACTDAISNPSAANCGAYIPNCLFNGSTCIAPEADCANYTPYGANDAAKASICNSLSKSGPVKCTYFAGSSKCVNTGACNSYNLSAN